MKEFKVCVVGLGYVGLPLYIEFSKKFNVIGYDKDKVRVDQLNKSYDSNGEHNQELENVSLNFTSQLIDITGSNIFIVTVPTPVNKDNLPNLNFLGTVFSDLGGIIKKDDLIILESTVYPGCSEEFCIPILEKESALKLNKDFYFGYSPERINPGDKINTLPNIIKITSGSNKYASKLVKILYETIITAGVRPVSSIKVAEASKILENTQRDLNISLINEFALICDRLDIKTVDVIEAASSKWNFQKFTPGLVGGHCISVDPYYLTYKSLQVGYQPDVILSGRRVNESIPNFIVHKTLKKIIANGKKISKSNVLLLGSTFKENCSDFRNSKVIDIYHHLKDYMVKTDIYDPLINGDDFFREFGIRIISDLKKYDAIIITVPHKEFLNINLQKLMKDEKTVVFDVKGLYKNPKYIQL